MRWKSSRYRPLVQEKHTFLGLFTLRGKPVDALDGVVISAITLWHCYYHSYIELLGDMKIVFRFAPIRTWMTPTQWIIELYLQFLTGLLTALMAHHRWKASSCVFECTPLLTWSHGGCWLRMGSCSGTEPSWHLGATAPSALLNPLTPSMEAGISRSLTWPHRSSVLRYTLLISMIKAKDILTWVAS